jgi:aspartate/methionine/tyrosine aminotransferase
MIARPPLPVSPAVRDLPEASSILINQMVSDYRRKGEDIITLSLGEAFFRIPMMDLSKIDIEKSYHYSDSRGILGLRERISDYYSRRYAAPVDPHTEILISAGSKALIYMSILAVVSAGDEVLIHEPAWLSYPHHVQLAGGTPKFIPHDRRTGDFAEYFTKKTRMVILCNPNNPAGRMYSEEELSDLYQTCRDMGIYLLIDEAYSDFAVDEKFVSIARLVPDKNGIIAVNSMSKNMGISGWRIGYVISHRDFIFQLLKLNQHIITCAPTILLMYCERYFDELLAITLPQIGELGEKRRRVRSMLDEIGLRTLAGGSTFYFFVSIGNYPGNSTDFALSMLAKRRVAVVPGAAYGQSTDRFVRVSIGTEPEDRIRHALMELKRETEANGVDRELLRQRLGSSAMEGARAGLDTPEHDPEKWTPVFGTDHAPPIR